MKQDEQILIRYFFKTFKWDMAKCNPHLLTQENSHTQNQHESTQEGYSSLYLRNLRLQR